MPQIRWKESSQSVGVRGRINPIGGGVTSWRGVGAVILLCVLAAVASQAQKLTTLASFNYSNGALPYDAPVQGFDGNLYGTSSAGKNGSVFQITPAGTLTVLYNFCSQPSCNDGQGPTAPLTLGVDGNFYGVTGQGGTAGGNACPVGCGTVFKISATGSFSGPLYEFCSQTSCVDGIYPDAALIQGNDGNFYGVTYQGGSRGVAQSGYGTLFLISPTGSLTSLFSFFGSFGTYPSSLLQGVNGKLYGTTWANGGKGNIGTVFASDLDGNVTVLYRFCSVKNTHYVCLDGQSPVALTQAADGSLYGLTRSGGANNWGTVFKLTLGGTLTTLYNFCSQPKCLDGAVPNGALVQGTDGNLYGTTQAGGLTRSNCPGPAACGTIFRITPSGAFTSLYDFCSLANCTDGIEPLGGVFQATDGDFYGTTYGGGSGPPNYIGGTVFRLSTGLKPFVRTLPTSGAVGAQVTILGTNLTGATAVHFNGKAAQFNVVSATEITSTVPVGATTGKVTVTTPRGTLKSNVVFRVR